MEELRASITLDVGGTAPLGKEQVRADLLWKEVIGTVADLLKFFRSRVRGSVTETGPTSFDVTVNSDWQIPNVRTLLETAGLLGPTLNPAEAEATILPMPTPKTSAPDEERKPAA